VACELGVADVQELQRNVKNSDTLRKLGLGPLADGEAIKRDAWESLAGGFSPFQQAAAELRKGQPFRSEAGPTRPPKSVAPGAGGLPSDLPRG
jgi:hypothetical protein